MVANKRVLPLDRLRNQKIPPAGLGECGSCNKCLSAATHHLFYSAVAFTHLQSNPTICSPSFHSSLDKPLNGREIKYKLLWKSHHWLNTTVVSSKELPFTDRLGRQMQCSWEGHTYSGKKMQNSVYSNRTGSSVTSKHNCYGNCIVRKQL